MREIKVIAKAREGVGGWLSSPICAVMFSACLARYEAYHKNLELPVQRLLEQLWAGRKNALYMGMWLGGRNQRLESLQSFFRECVAPKPELSESSENLSSSFKDIDSSSKVACDIVCRGYMDDPCNTDQAWKEVELWHVHYDIQEMISERLQSQMGWRLITEDAFFKLPAGQAVLLQDIARKMKATIL